jgi:hypothetical protein
MAPLQIAEGLDVAVLVRRQTRKPVVTWASHCVDPTPGVVRSPCVSDSHWVVVDARLLAFDVPEFAIDLGVFAP